MRIAVVGSGISGLSAAYLLAPHAEVTLFEAAPQLGGHAHTATVTFPDGTTIPVDTGFMVYNPVRYPYFSALLAKLAVSSVDTVMSFSAHIPGQVLYNSEFRGLFGNIAQCMNPRYIRMIVDIIRFNHAAKRFLKNPDTTLLLGDFLQRHAFSEEFATWYLYPMMASIWSAGTDALPTYPAYETFRFLNNHLLLNTITKARWKTISGGSVRYVEALAQELSKSQVAIRLNTPVSKITRTSATVTITTDQDETSFDHVLIATHANDALTLLHDATRLEQDILGLFSYSTNRVTLHSDTSFMPPRKNTWASWNYAAEPGVANRVSLTYNMNSLQHIPEAYPLLVTLNPAREPHPELIHHTYSYTHPIFNASARVGQARMREIHTGRTHYIGAHLGFGFHEDGIASAVAAVAALGFPIRLHI